MGWGYPALHPLPNDVEANASRSTQTATVTLRRQADRRQTPVKATTKPKPPVKNRVTADAEATARSLR